MGARSVLISFFTLQHSFWFACRILSITRLLYSVLNVPGEAISPKGSCDRFHVVFYDCKLYNQWIVKPGVYSIRREAFAARMDAWR